MKNYEQKVLVKFISLYMVTSFVLLSFISIMFYYDQKDLVVKELEDEMIAFISLSRNGNNEIENDYFEIEAQPSEHHDYPVFYEDKSKEKFVSVTCASKYYPDQVFVVSADKSVLSTKLWFTALKIFITMFIGFLFFLGLAYYLARVSIRPIERSRKIINNVIEELVHDLNAPMTSISLNCENLDNKLSDEKDLKYVQRINNSNKTIRFLYNNLQLLTDDPAEVVIEQEFSINSMIEDKVAFYTDLYPETQFELDLISVKYKTDVIAFERVIDNLLSNAIKYSRDTPKIKIVLVGNTLSFSDNGIGIKDCKKIFERHYREIQGTTCAYGFGLGLAIVKKLCDQMKIDITLDSTENVGSTFTLTLAKEFIV